MMMVNYNGVNEINRQLICIAQRCSLRSVWFVLLMHGSTHVVQMNDIHPYRFRLKTVDRVYRFAVDTSGTLSSLKSDLFTFDITQSPKKILRHIWHVRRFFHSSVPERSKLHFSTFDNFSDGGGWHLGFMFLAISLSPSL